MSDTTYVETPMTLTIAADRTTTEVNAGNGKHAIFVSYPEGVSEVLKVCGNSEIAPWH
jgi:hypothetical protein